jgi:two-component system, cell cycle sensor histidine kinase PleC
MKRKMQTTIPARTDEINGKLFSGRGTGTPHVPLTAPAQEQALRNSAANKHRADVSRAHRKEILELRKKTREAEIATTSILSNLNHEFRTPLNAVIGFSELLLSDATGELENPIHRDYIEDIHESAFRLLEMVNDLLDTVNVSEGLSDITSEPTELIDIVLQARDSVESMSATRGVNLEFEADCAKCHIEADRQRFYQAIRQVLAEAVRRAPPGGTILIRVGTEGNAVKIAFSCLTYWQGALNASHMSGGIDLSGISLDNGGIGAVDPDLSIARTVLELHGGSLNLTSVGPNGLEAVLESPKVRNDRRPC